MGLKTQAAGIGSLAEPVRRALYEYVVAQSQPVGREEAAVAVDVPGHKANFHLDRLVDEGLLEVEFRRLTGRTGPGAGRPAKLYRRSAREWLVSLPPRRYDLVGHILAAGVERAGRDGMPLDDALHEAARTEGTGIGDEARVLPESPSLSDVLANQGYQPRTEDDAIVLANCPFDSLAQEHTALVCGLNCSFVQGVAEGLGRDDVKARLEPRLGHCCVTLRSTRTNAPGRRAAGGPFERAAPAPRVVDLDARRALAGDVDVVEERKGRGANSSPDLASGAMQRRRRLISPHMTTGTEHS